MAAYALPALYAVLVWWFSTGLILLLDHRPRATHAASMAAGTGVLALALWAIGASAEDASAGGAYVAFTAALLVWGWQEMSYYMGFVSGPRAVGCPPGATGFARFRAAAATSLWHEAAIVAAGLAILTLTWDGPNRFALWTYLVLWAMNLSARLNLFLGVRNLNAEFLPAHLAYLGSYLRVRSMNPLYPASVAVAALVTGALARAALGDGATAHEVAGLSILATLMALATLEHGFLMLPLPSAALWQWSLPKASRPGFAPGPAKRGEGPSVASPATGPACLASPGLVSPSLVSTGLVSTGLVSTGLVSPALGTARLVDAEGR